eukprot:COSAG02_NODE_35590_length_466_cov_0.828338_1_plen_116_part_10
MDKQKQTVATNNTKRKRARAPAEGAVGGGETHSPLLDAKHTEFAPGCSNKRAKKHLLVSATLVAVILFLAGISSGGWPSTRDAIQWDKVDGDRRDEWLCGTAATSLMRDTLSPSDF